MHNLKKGLKLPCTHCQHGKNNITAPHFGDPFVSFPSHTPSIYPEEMPVLKCITLFLFCLIRLTCSVPLKKCIITCCFVSNIMQIEMNGLDTCSSFFQTYIFTLSLCSCILFIFTMVGYSNATLYLSILLLIDIWVASRFLCFVFFYY